MNWKAHAVFGAAAAVVLLYLLGTTEIFSIMLVAVFGALSGLVPDLDHESSKGKKLLDIIFIPFALVVAYISVCGRSLCLPDGSMAVTFLAFIGLYSLFFFFLKPRHRGITHTLVAALLFALALYFLVDLNFVLAGFAGYLSHLAADREIKLL